MTMCVSPPEVDDMQLAAFVAGEGDGVTLEHLAVCPYCRAKAARMRRTHQSLARPLFRLHCPSPDALRDFYFGFLADGEMAGVKQHLQSCARCTREFLQMEAFLAEEATPAAQEVGWQGLGEWVKTILAELLPRGEFGGMRPALGLRGTEEDRHDLYQAGEWQIAIRSERDPQMMEGRVVLGAMLGGEMEEGEEWTAHLWQEQRLVAGDVVDEFGSFRVVQIVPGRYEMVVAGADFKIHFAEVIVR